MPIRYNYASDINVNMIVMIMYNLDILRWYHENRWHFQKIVMLHCVKLGYEIILICWIDA